jgi:hypothetical protein
MTKILTNRWKEVHILTPKVGAAHAVGVSLVRLLDDEFRPYDDEKIQFWVSDDELYATDVNAGRIKPEESLHVVIYDDPSQLAAWDRKADVVIGVYAPFDDTQPREIDFRQFVNDTQGLEHVIHTRVGVGENAAMFVAECLYISHPNLKPNRFDALRRKKSTPRVEEFLRLSGLSRKVHF